MWGNGPKERFDLLGYASSTTAVLFFRTSFSLGFIPSKIALVQANSVAAIVALPWGSIQAVIPRTRTYEAMRFPPLTQD